MTALTAAAPTSRPSSGLTQPGIRRRFTSRPAGLGFLLVGVLLLSGCGTGRSQTSWGGGVRVPLIVVRQGFSTRAFVPVTVSGHRYLFVLDSGAALTVIRPGVAATAGLSVQRQSRRASVVGCQTSYHAAEVPHWSVGSITLHRKLVAVQNLVGIPDSVDGQPVAGLLGADVLASLGQITLELAHGELILGGSAALGDAQNVTVVDGRDGARAVIAQLHVSGRPVNFLLDTGANLTIASTALTRSAHLPTLGPSTTGHGASGCQQHFRPVEIDTWTTGKTRLPSTYAFTGGFPDAFRTVHFDGILGSDVLYAFGKVVIDFRTSKLALEEPRYSGSSKRPAKEEPGR